MQGTAARSQRHRLTTAARYPTTSSNAARMVGADNIQLRTPDGERSPHDREGCSGIRSPLRRPFRARICLHELGSGVKSNVMRLRKAICLLALLCSSIGDAGANPWNGKLVLQGFWW